MKSFQSYLCFLLFIFCFLLASSDYVHSQQISVVKDIALETIPDESFELTIPNDWIYSGVAGVASNNNPNNPNPDTPFGDSLLFLKNMGSATQTVRLAKDGCYRIKIWAAQLNVPDNEMTFRILINDEEVAEITPDSIVYEEYQSVAIKLKKGYHNLKLEAISLPQIILLDNVQMENIPCWSDTLTWSTNTVPSITDDAIVNNDKSVVLDVDGAITQIDVEGEFLAANNCSLAFDAERILIKNSTGFWQWGQEHTPYENVGIITLRGDFAQSQVFPTPGSAFLAAMNGAKIQIHGREKLSWTQLDSTALQGDTSIILKETVDWEIGDEIVIASSDFDCHQAETRIISSINGTAISFAQPLIYDHFGELQTYNNGSRDFVLDERTEVGLLTRNLKIQGDSDADSDGYGGHVMIMAGSYGYVSGVEFFRMGQKSLLGRYPFHWHLTGDVSGQYIKNSSIHHSFNRIITVHSSNNALIEDNVAYDHIGNGYFLENGDETGNQFIHNLGILTLAAAPGEEVRPYDSLHAEGTNTPFLLRLPATFWITHPDNDFVGNACGGSEGSGFWMVVQPKPIEGTNPNGIFPRFSPLGLFDDNRSHSTSFSNFSIDLKIETNEAGEHLILSSGTYQPTNIPVVNRFTSYKCKDRAIWMRTNTLHFDSCSSGDNSRSTFFAYNNVIFNSLYVGQSDNLGTPSTWLANENYWGRSLPIPGSFPDNYSIYNHFKAHPLYDGPSGLINCHFADYDGDNATVFSPNTAATKSTVHYVENLSFTNVPTENKFSQLFSKDRDFQWTTGIIDKDGSIDSLTNPGDVIKPEIIEPENTTRRVYEKGFNNESAAVYVSEWEHYICPEEHYGLLLMYYGWADARKTPMYSLRSDGHATFTLGQDFKNQIPVLANTVVRYSLQYHRLPNDLHLLYKFLNQGDTTTFIVPNLPSGTYISKNGGNIPQAGTLSEFNNSTDERYFFNNNTLYFRLKANSITNTKQFGQDYKYTSNINICQDQSCTPETQGGNYGMSLADYERGLDTRAMLNTNGNLNLGSIGFNATASPYDGIDDSNSFTITSDGDALDEYVEYRLAFSRQIWSEFNNLKLNHSGAKVQVLLHDNSEGDIHLGYVESNSCFGLDLTRLDKETIDEVDGLVIRVFESDLGDYQTPGLTANIVLNDIYLDYSIQLSEFHTDLQGWHTTGATTTIDDGIITMTGTASNSRLGNDLFFGKPPVDLTEMPKVVIRMKNNSSATKGTFYHMPWGSGWTSNQFDLISDGQFHNYLIDNIWTTGFDLQRMMLQPMNGAPSGNVEIDYIRFTTCDNCYNEQMDGLETGVDCGGPDCYPCQCEDGIQNGDEEGIDCGGSCPNVCSTLVFENSTLQGVSDNWITVNTQNSYTNMVVVATPVLKNISEKPIVTRIQNVTTNSFDIKLQNPGNGNAGNHVVHYFVVEEGVYTDSIDGITMEAVLVNSALTAISTNWVFESHNYQNTYNNPVVLGQVHSYNDTEWSVFWASEDMVRNNPPSSGITFSAGKEIAQDINNTTRADETIGYVIIEQGIYNINDQLLEAGLGPDNVKGVGDLQVVGGGRYYTEPVLDINSVVLSSAAMDGTDGGWPVLYGAAPIGNQSFQLRIDEDQIKDAERKHTTEQVAFLAIGSHSTALSGDNSNMAMRSLQATKNNDQNPSNHLKIYPNPANDVVNIRMNIETSALLSIMNAAGQEIYKTVTSGNELHLNTSQWSSGLYLVRLNEEGTINTAKLIIYK